MKPLARSLAATFLLILFFPRCGNRRPDKTAIAEDFTIIPMEQYTVDSSAIQTGTQVRIVAYSGGKTSKDKKLYFSQFIVVDLSTADTTRILAAAIGIDSSAGASSEYLSPADAFDGQKGVFDAIYEVPTAGQNSIISDLPDLAAANSDTEKMTASMSDTTAVKEFVLVNRNAEIFRRKYKTAKGILRFHVQPWSE